KPEAGAVWARFGFRSSDFFRISDFGFRDWEPLMKSLFASARKILIGVVHLRPLPGAPRFGGSLTDAIKAAVADAVGYERGGAHAVFVENFGDVPFTKGRVGPETIAAMTAAGCAVRAAV